MDFIESILNGDKEYSEENFNKAIEILNGIEDMVDNSNRQYTYDVPDYSERVGELPVALYKLEVSGEDDDLYEEDYEELCKEVAFLDREELVSGLDSVIYGWLAEFHRIENDEESKDFTATTPMQWAVRLVERFGARECIPTLLEVLRQNKEILDYFFDDEDMFGLIPSCIYQIMTVEDMPMLMEFVKEEGITTVSKTEIMAVLATLPRREPKTLGMVQKWLTELLEYFEKNFDKTILDDNLMIEAAINCCIHTRNVDAKKTIIRMYGKFILPDILIPGGVNEVRKSIKKADIGVIDVEKDSAEKIYQMAMEEYADDDWEDEEDCDDEKDWNDEEEEDELLEEWDEEEDFDYSKLKDQTYHGWASGGKFLYKPVKNVYKYSLKISLDKSKPSVWRKLEVPSNIRLTSLAQAILLAMGWDEDHMHQFAKGNKYYATHEYEINSGFNMSQEDGSKFCIGNLLDKKGDKVRFEYDYGDSWNHIVLLEDVAEYGDDDKKKVCLIDGKNACPPDDCGGIYGYMNMINVMKNDPESDEAMEYFEWLGTKWNTELTFLDEARKMIDRNN